MGVCKRERERDEPYGAKVKLQVSQMWAVVGDVGYFSVLKAFRERIVFIFFIVCPLVCITFFFFFGCMLCNIFVDF